MAENGRWMRLCGEKKSEQPESKLKTKKSSAQISRDYRQRLKEDPEVYRAYRNYDNLRVKEYLFNLDEKKKAEYREKTRLRVQRHRMKKKEEGLPEKPKVQTRRIQDQKREKWREQKRLQLASESEEQRRRRNAKRRENYAKKQRETAIKKKEAMDKANKKKEAVLIQNNPLGNSPYKSTEALRKATYRTSQSLPKSGVKAANVLARMIARSTPRKRQMLKEKLLSPKSKKTSPGQYNI